MNPTRILLISDVHTEFYGDKGASFARTLAIHHAAQPPDVLVIAGDLGDATCTADAIETFAGEFSEIVYVAGNHEFYEGKILKVLDKLARCDAAHSNFHWLNRTRAVVAGVPFVGCTLWFRRDIATWHHRESIADFSCIKGGFTDWVIEENARDRAFLEGEVAQGDVVVTHHLPHRACVAERFERSAINSFFLCEVPEALANGPSHWLHGHTHDPVDVVVGDTRILCNPVGYPNEYKPAFDPGCIILL